MAPFSGDGPVLGPPRRRWRGFLVGLPGTLGFCSEDLLIHGTLLSHPQIGLLLPVATAMNAVSLFRLFSKMFLGKQSGEVRGVSDALPRERWVLAAIVVFIVAAGLMPSRIVALRTNAAQAISRLWENPRTSLSALCEPAGETRSSP